MPVPDCGGTEKPFALHYFGTQAYVGPDGLGVIHQVNGAFWIGYNAYYDANAAAWKYIISGVPAFLLGFQVGSTANCGELFAAAGTADATITWTTVSAGKSLAILTQTSTGTTGVTSTETAITGLADTGTQFKASGQDRYKITLTVTANHATTGGLIDFNIRDGGGSAPTNASTLVGTKTVACAVGAQNQDYDLTFYTPLTTTLSAGTHHLGAFIKRNTGTGATAVGTATPSSTHPFILQVELA